MQADVRSQSFHGPLVLSYVFSQAVQHHRSYA
jgi:hypothetical protein